MTAIRVLRLLSRGVGAGALLLMFSIGTALAQSGASTGLMGRVTDSSGAAVPGVAVTLTNVETGSARTVTSSATGDWEARFLTPGTYRVTFELTGFKTLRRDGLTVSTAEMATVNVTLEIGTLAEAVDVVANAEMVSSGSMTVSRTLDQKELEALPTSARNFTQLLVIEPGVSADISELLSNDNASISPSVNGARTTNNSFVFNGVDVTNLLCCNSRDQRIERHDRKRRRIALAKHRAGARDAAGGQAADEPLRRRHRAQRRRQLHAGVEERHQQLSRQRLLLQPERRADGQRLLLQSRGHREADPEPPRRRRHDRRPDRQEQDVLLRVVSAHAGRDLVRGRGEQHRAAAASAHRRSLRRRHRQLSRRRSGTRSTARSTSASSTRSRGRCSRRSFPTARYLIPSGVERHQLPAERHAAVRELPGRLGHPRHLRAGSVHDERRPSVDRGEQAERQVLLLEPAEPGSAGQRQRADAVRARGHDLPADVLAHRPAHLQPDGAERVPRRLLPQPQRQQPGGVLHQRPVRDRRTRSTPWSPT